MSAARKANPTSISTRTALAEAKQRRADVYAYKDARILSMVADEVPKKHIAVALGVSRNYITKVLAKSEVKP